MGKRGPPRTPTSILKINGSRLVAGRQDEPQPDSGRPTCPASLQPGSKRIWKSLVPILDGMGVLTKADARALARYCRYQERWLRAEAALEIDPDDASAAKTADGLGDKLLKLEVQFGLTPSARASMTLPEQKRQRVPVRQRGAG